MLAKGQMIVPVIGARTRTQLSESLGALQVQLSLADIARIEEAINAAEPSVSWASYPKCA